MPFSASDWAPLQGILHDILLKQTDGLSEYELFKQLQSAPYQVFSADALNNPLSLFQSHFILFNALYQLQATWFANNTAILQIHCSCIRHTPWHAGHCGLVEQDKLRAYYLDWNNLSDTDLVQVEAMLDSFWSAFSDVSNPQCQPSMSQQQALALLDLSAPFSDQQLKHQYRKMLHQHHPDKGGSHSHTMQLYNAYNQLKSS